MFLTKKKCVHADFGAYCYEGLRCSLCHGWSCGPAPFLSQYVLGVKILESGCKKISVKPNLAQLKYVKGTYPTPHGNVEIESEKKGSKTISKINAPKEIEVLS